MASSNKPYIEHSFHLNDYITTNIEAINMEINSALILRLEKLANLQLTEQERQKLGDDLGKIVDMVNQLQEVNTDGVEPLIYLSDRGAVLRKDEVNHQLDINTALANAPQQDGTYFQVPKVSKK